MSVKAPNSLSDEQLLAILGDKPLESQTPLKTYYKNDILEFISIYNLKEGNDKVKIHVLYNLYKLWSKNPINKRTFGKEITPLFSSIHGRTCTIFLLNKASLNLKEECWKLLKPQDKRKYPGYKLHFDKYLFKYSIKKGSFFVKDIVLYNLYDKWCFKRHKIVNRKPLGLNQFINFCKLYFDCRLIKGHSWFGVDHSIQQHLTEENNMKKETNAKKEEKS